MAPLGAACWYDWLAKTSEQCQDPIDDFELARLQASIRPTQSSSVSLGEQAFAVGERLHANHDPRAVDYWARSIAWMDDARRQNSDVPPSRSCRTSRVRQSAWIRILSCGKAYGRLDPTSHLLVNGISGTCRIPVAHQGFAWKSNDFDRLLVFEPPTGEMGNVRGRGIPLVVLTQSKSPGLMQNQRCDCSSSDGQHSASCDKFLLSQTPFAATALIHLPISLFEETIACDEVCSGNVDVATVTLVNPLTVNPMGGDVQIAQSPAMPLLYARQASQYNPIAAFIRGDNGVDRPELRFLEPYQTDKIPLILVHGLVSDPATFLEMADAVRADPLLRTRYQIWVFRYPTGDDFLKSAAALRQKLAEAFACQSAGAVECELPATDHPSQRAVIVGHSLGGLLSKLQVTNSGDRLWRAVSSKPLDQLQGTPQDIADLQKSFFFNASPHIGRVVYIATPHKGSPWASRGIGRLASLLARGKASDGRDYEEVVAANPGVFSDSFSGTVQSSVQLLRPSSSLLQALAATPSSPDVIVNSIIGEHCRLPRAGQSDVVVPVDSAYREEAETTTVVDATHTSILRSSTAQYTLLKILTEHLAAPGTNCEPDEHPRRQYLSLPAEVQPPNLIPAPIRLSI
ncbi:esterase/lipase family protein [Roseimaritima multifibrata]|uniref:esterase/lipase family protein n=1 Tax=Roseimaritima multifibrata TaxID=1930274 RepID=UPI001C54D25A|nr:alpha/beta fold hydrolase [Roseimaritima multifibrata]